MKRFRSFLAFLVVVTAVCTLPASAQEEEEPSPGEARVSKLIVGGKKAMAGQIPWQVALIDGQSTSVKQFCGGSLVAPQWVLTAAHCVDNWMVRKDPTRVDVVGGTLEYATGGERIDVSEIIVHDKWGQTGTEYDYDAALLKLAKPATAAKPIALMSSGGTLATGMAVRVSGWGAISESGPGSSELLYVDVPVVDNATCNKPETYNGAVSAQMFCAGVREGGLDSCQGDSGGPVAFKQGATDVLVGVVSWGHGCARELKYGVYTRVPAISTWASEQIGPAEP